MENWQSVGEKNIYGIGMFCAFLLLPLNPGSHAANKVILQKNANWAVIREKKKKLTKQFTSACDAQSNESQIVDDFVNEIINHKLIVK